MEELESLILKSQQKVSKIIMDLWEKINPSQDSWIVFTISLCAIFPAWVNYDILSLDGAQLYIPVAKLFLKGKFQEAIFSPMQPLILPLYEVLIYLMAKITGFGLETSGRLVSVISFLFAAVGLYRITDLICKNRIVSFLSVLLLLANRELLVCSVDCLKESLLVALVVWGNYFILKGISSEGRLWFFLVGSMFFIAGSLVRSTSLIFPIAWGILWTFHKKNRLLVRLFVFLLPIVFVVILYYMNSQYHWKLPLFRRSYGLSKLTHLDISSLILMEYSLNMVRQFLAKWYYIIAVFGFLGSYWMKREIYSIFFLTIFIIFFLVCTLTGFFSIDRYIILPVVAIYPLAAYAIMRSYLSRNIYAKVLVGVTITFCVFLLAEKVFTPPDSDKLARKEAGLWILSHVGSERALLTNRPRIGFYADTTPYILFQFKDLKKKNSIIAKKAPYWRNDKVRLSELKGNNGLTMAVALDLSNESQELNMMLEKFADWKLKPDKVFESIQVYLPRP